MSDTPLEPIAPPRAASLGELVRRLVDDSILLMRSELSLARSELRAGIGSASGSIGMIAAGGMMTMVALFCLLGALVAYLAEHVGIVAAALIVAAAAAVIGGGLIVVGINRLKSVEFMAPRAIAGLARDVETLKGD